MKSNPLPLGKLSWGLIVMFVGIILLLENLDILTFHWFAVLRFWPILIILFGINVLLPKRIEGQILSIMATLLALVFFTFQGIGPQKNNFEFDGFQRSPKRDQAEPNGQLLTLSREYDSTISNATLNISGGAVEYTIAKTTDKLIEVNAYSNFSRYSLSSSTKDGESVLDLSQKSQKAMKFKKLSGDNTAKIQLNPQMVWDINLSLGAGKADFNLKPFKIRNITLQGGASSLNIMLGMPVEKLSTMKFDGGVSSLKIQIPKSAGCKIEAESALSSLEFPGFIKQEDGSYITENYRNAEQKFEIELDNGLSSIEVSRYE